MKILLDVLTWLGCIVGAFALAGSLVAAAMAWLLNHPGEDHDPKRSAPG